MKEFQDYLDAVLGSVHESGSWRDNRYVLTKAQLPLQVKVIKDKQVKHCNACQKRDEENPRSLDLLQGLREFYIHEPVLLIGKPGSGKSTALLRLLLEEIEIGIEALRQNPEALPKIPVLILLRSCDHGDVLDWIGEALEDLDLEKAKIRSLLKDGRLLLLFDGLNEVPNQDVYRSLTKFLEKWTNKVSMVFTTRELGADSALGISQKLEMMPLSELQMRDFIEKRLPGRSDEMLRQLGDRLRELAETPLLLNMLCQVFDQSGEIPKSRGELFRNKFIQDFDAIKHKGVVAADSGFFDYKDEILQHLAMKMIVGDDTPTGDILQVGKSTAQAWITEYLTDQQVSNAGPKAKEWLHDLLEHHILQIADKTKDIEFHHQLFQEYYAAEWLLERVGKLDDETLECDYLNYLKWTEPLALMLALVDDEKLAVRVVDRALAADLMLGARLAGEVRSEFQEKTIGLVQNAELPTHLKPPEWMEIELLGITRSDYAVPLLKYIIFDSNQYSELDSSAAWELRHMSSHIVVPILEKAFQEKGKFVKYRVIDALIEIKFDSVVSLALSENDAQVRYYVMHKICKFCTEDSVIGIVHLIALSKRNLKILQPKIIKYRADGLEDLTEDTAFEIEKKTISFGTHFIKNMSLDIVNSALIRCIDTSKDDSKIIALKFLGESNNTGMKIQKESPFVYKENVLGEDTKGIQISYHKSYLSNSNSTVRANAVFDIAFLEKKISDELVAVIIEMLNDSNIQTSTHAAMTITRLAENIPDQKFHLSVAVPKMIELFKNSDKLNRGSFAQALGILGSPEDQEICQVLISAVKESNSIGFPYEIRAIGCLKCQEAVPIMLDKLDGLDGADSHIQASILEVFPGIKGSEKILPDLWKIIDASLGNSVFTSIQGIQSNCKFYNYDIYKKTIDRKPTAAARGNPTNDTYYDIKAEVVQIIGNNNGTVIGNHNQLQEPPC